MHTLDELRIGRLAGATRLCLREQLEYFPKEIYALADSLEILDLSQNRLHELPDDFGCLKKLRILFASENNFDVLPTVLRDCPELSMIGFKSNRIADVSENALPANLRWLILTDNRIAQLPESMGMLTRLQKLMLAGNRLKDLPESMRACAHLELLRISANRFEAIPPWLLTLPRLAWLACAGNPCSHTPDREMMGNIQRIAWEELHLGEQLGCGASGHIHQALHLVQEHSVAVKLFKGSVTSDGYPADELRACMAAGEHENLAQVRGRLEQHPDAKEGLILSLIPPQYKNLGNPPSFDTCTRDTFDETTRFPLKGVQRIAVQMASALQHLHARGIMHGDLYAHNILIDDAWHALIGDFGAATFYDGEGMNGVYERLDVRAYGALLEDMMLRLEPVANQQMQKQVDRLWDLTRRCLSETIQRRPLFAAIVAILEEMVPC